MAPKSKSKSRKAAPKATGATHRSKRKKANEETDAKSELATDGVVESTDAPSDDGKVSGAEVLEALQGTLFDCIVEMSTWGDPLRIAAAVHLIANVKKDGGAAIAESVNRGECMYDVVRTLVDGGTRGIGAASTPSTAPIVSSSNAQTS